MAKTIVGLFDDVNEAHTAVQELMDAGVDHNAISIVANDAKGEYKQYKADGSSAAEGAGAGAVGGGVLGGVLGLLVGVGALAIPGIGPVLAAGPLAAALGAAGASTLVGAGVGAATGGLIGGLIGLGIPEEDANMYAEGVRRGGTLVT
ncbi:MAG: general stress protein, partial [Roseiflexaceae bacterium]